MPRLSKNAQNLDYMRLRPKTIYWKVIAPKDAKLSFYQTFDTVFDDYDLKIRKI